MVAAPFVGQDPGDFGRGGCADQFGLRVARGGDGEGDDEDVDVGQGGDEGGGVVVVDIDGLDAGGDDGGAVCAGEGCDVEFLGGEEFFGDKFADLTAGLGWLLAVGSGLRGEGEGEGEEGETYPYDGDVLHVF